MPRNAPRTSAIVSTSSATGLRGVPTHAAYAASKAAVINLTLTASLELRPLGIRVNCVCPGIVETPMLQAIGPAFESLAPVSIDELIAAKQARLGEPEEIARAIAYLASPRAAFVSGVALPVDNALSASLF